VAYALGQHNLGELYICERTLYDFRKRVYAYTLAHPEEEVFRQFEVLRKHFPEITKINTKEQRIDSTAIMPNIRRASRLALVLKKFFNLKAFNRKKKENGKNSLKMPHNCRLWPLIKLRLALELPYVVKD